MNQPEPITTFTLDRDLSRIVILTYPHAATIAAYALNTKQPTLLSQHYLTRGATWERSEWHGTFGPTTTLRLTSIAKPLADRRASKSIRWHLDIIKEDKDIFHIDCRINMPGPINASSSQTRYTFWHFPAAIAAFATLEQWIKDNTPCPK